MCILASLIFERKSCSEVLMGAGCATSPVFVDESRRAGPLLIQEGNRVGAVGDGVRGETVALYSGSG